MDVIPLDLPRLGNRTHLVHDGEVALVVDPPRSLGAVEEAAELAGVRIVAVAETHVHNDYVSGGLALARRHRADYLLSADEAVAFDHAPVRGGDVVGVGTLRVEVVATPGHTIHHQAFHVTPSEGPGAGAVLTGGSLLGGTVGRTDLVDPALARHLARVQWSSVRRLASLPAATTVHPTHGFGSLCAGSAVQDVGMTIGDQAVLNPALTTDRETFVDRLVAGFGPVPRHYRHMAALNRSGAGAAAPLGPVEVDGAGLEAARRRGAWLLDLRSRRAFAAGHVPGSLNVEHGDQFALWASWVTPWQAELVLLGDDAAVLEQAADDLAQIGVEAPLLHLLPATTEDRESYRQARWEDLTWPPTGRVLLDVRHEQEVAAERVPGSVAIPLPDLARRLHEVPPGEVWVYCRSGYRAAVAAGLLARAGRTVVHVDDAIERAPLGRPVPRAG